MTYISMRNILWIFILFFPYLLSGQTICSPESREKLESTLQRLSQMDDSVKSLPNLITEIGPWFLGTAYVEKTLELPGEEQLVINLTGLDCTTYVETVLSLALQAKTGNLTFKDFEKNLEWIRYADGKRNGYPSRLHYFSDWIFQNQEKGLLKDITSEIGGIPYANQPSFMSQNPQYYPQLSNPEYVMAIQDTEAKIKMRTSYYIPKERIADMEKSILSGDLIAITSSLSNLDIAHVGFAVVKNGRIHLLHASSQSKKVEITERPLIEYLQNIKSQSGIMVSRFK